jgi:hypothetical protein
VHVGGCDGIVAVIRVRGHGNGEGEADEEDGDEETDGEVVAVDLRCGKDEEREWEEGAECDAEDGEVVWDTEALLPA